MHHCQYAKSCCYASLCEDPEFAKICSITIEHYPQGTLVSSREIPRIIAILEGYGKAYTYAKSGERFGFHLLGAGSCFYNFSFASSNPNNPIQHLLLDLWSGSDMTICSLDIQAMNDYMFMHPEKVAASLYSGMLAYTACLRHKWTLEASTMQKKVLRTLVLLHDLQNGIGRPEPITELNVTQDEVADYLGVSRPSVNAALKQLVNMGYINMGNRYRCIKLNEPFFTCNAFMEYQALHTGMAESPTFPLDE